MNYFVIEANSGAEAIANLCLLQSPVRNLRKIYAYLQKPGCGPAATTSRNLRDSGPPL